MGGLKPFLLVEVLTFIYNIDTLLNVIYFEPFGLKISKMKQINIDKKAIGSYTNVN